jgi:hypothetical protein
MTPFVRKLVLTVHIGCAVGWIGAVAAFLAVSVVAAHSGNAAFVPGAYGAMDVISRWVAIPASVGALTSGFVQAVAGPWGLRRYYWVIFKWILASVATVALVIHQLAAVRVAAEQALLPSAGAGSENAAWADLQFELLRAPIIALVILLCVLTLAVFKPWGPTAYGQRTQPGAIRGAPPPRNATPLGARVAFLVVALCLLAFIAAHLFGGGFHHHG